MPKKPKPKRGAPPGPRVSDALRRELIAVRLEHWMVVWMRSRDETQTELIEEALKEKHRLRAP
jgi:hypothetical protein